MIVEKWEHFWYVLKRWINEVKMKNKRRKEGEIEAEEGSGKVGAFLFKLKRWINIKREGQKKEREADDESRKSSSIL